MPVRMPVVALPLTLKEREWLPTLKSCVAYRKSLDRLMGLEPGSEYAQDEAWIAELEQRSEAAVPNLRSR